MVKVSLLELQRSRPRVASMAEVSQLSKIGFERVEIKFWMARAILTLCASVSSGAKEKIEKKKPPEKGTKEEFKDGTMIHECFLAVHASSF